LGRPQADAGTRDRVRQWLTLWRGEPDLAGLREPAELAKLPSDERRDCLALWTAADGLLERAEGAAPKP
jgi:eukaryotic-like serine/threonine-protein kinase